MQVKAQGTEVVNTYPLEITYHKTTSIIFPAAISSVDRGSRDILAQKARGVENILQLKAGTTDFPESNLTVITTDGKLHHFIISYASQPEDLIIEVGKVDGMNQSLLQEPSPVIFRKAMTKTVMAECSEVVLAAKRSFRFVSKKNYSISMVLHGIYIKGNTLFFYLKLKNNSNIDYDIDLLRFSILDRKQVKRTASQEVDVKPIYIHGNAAVPVKGKSEADLVYALEKFTIPDAKRLVIELIEKNGGRHLELSVKDRLIGNAKPLENTNSHLTTQNIKSHE